LTSERPIGAQQKQNNSSISASRPLPSKTETARSTGIGVLPLRVVFSCPVMPHRLPHALRELVAAGQSFAPASRLLSSSTPLLHTSSPISSLLHQTSLRTCHTGRSASLLQASSPQSTTAKRNFSWPRMTGKEEPKEVRKYLQQSHDRIFENNKKWADEMRNKNPGFFKDLSAGQAPEYLWIGELHLE